MRRIGVTTAGAVIGLGALGAATGWGAMAYQSTSSGAGGNRPIMVAADDGSSPVQVARGANPVISPNGSRVAYQVLSRSAIGTRVVDVATRTVAPVAKGCGEFGAVTWSPDSTRIVCGTMSTARDGTVTGQGLAMAQVPSGSLAGAGTLALTTLVPARGNNVPPPPQGVSFSPDGTQIAYAWARWEKPTGIYVAPVSDATARRRVLSSASSPVWGPLAIAATQERQVSVRIADTRMRTVQQNVWVVNPDGSDPRAITAFRARGLVYGPYAAFWTPDSTKVIGGIAGQDYSRTATFSTGARRTTTLLARRDTMPVGVSRDGAYIAFQPLLESSRVPVQVMRINGTGVRTIARNAMSPTFSADWQP